MSEIRIIGPDGSRFVFPAGTSREVMLNAMRRRYTGQERREREQTRDMILNSQLPGPGRAGVQEYLSRDQMRQDLAQARETNIAAQEAALIPEDTTRERFYTGAQGVTLGAAPLIQGATVAPMAALLYPFLTDDMRGGRSLSEFVSDMSGGAYQRARTDIARAREERPIESLALETAGGLFTGKTAYDKLGERFLQSRAAARGGVVGTGAGAQYGFLESEGDPGQTAQAAGLGGLFGAPVGKAIEGIANIGGRMFQRSRGMEVPEPVAEPEVLPAPESGRGYLGRRVFDNPPRPPNPRTEAERATWAPTATVLEQARTRASEAKAIADQTLQTRRPEDIARVKDQKRALIADIEATMAQREGMNTPDDQRLADALSALSEETSDPVFMSTQLGVAQRNLDQVMINQGMRPEPMRTPVQTVPPFRPTPSREQQARTIEGRPSRTRYAGGTPPDETPMGFNANTAIQAGLGSAGGSVAGSTTDLNGDGVIDMQDVAIGSVMGGVGLPLAGRAASRLDNALAGNRGVRGMGFVDEYGMEHRPMSPENGAARLHDLTATMPENIYSKDALQFYGSGDPREAEVLRIMKKVRNNPEAKVTIYRGVPKDATGINEGDWVTLSRSVAQDYADNMPEGGKVVEMQVAAKDISAWGDSLLEQGYFPQKTASDLPKPVQQARQAGYQGADTGESKEWLSAIRKGLRMDTESRMARAREQGFDTDTVLYHGTGRDFDKFDASRNRTQLNLQYQGDGFHFSADPNVASKYAGAARNDVIRKEDIYPLIDQKLSPENAALFKRMVEGGSDKAWDIPEAEIKKLIQNAEQQNIDLNDLTDLAEFVEGSRSTSSPDALNEIFSVFGGGASRGIPEWAWDIARRLGLEDALPKPNVIPVYARTGKQLKTSDPQKAKRAQSQGYDSVLYDGPGTVDGQPEIIIFDPKNIRSVHAAFDPEKSGSSELLAAVPFAVGGVGAGAAMQENDQ